MSSWSQVKSKSKKIKITQPIPSQLTLNLQFSVNKKRVHFGLFSLFYRHQIQLALKKVSLRCKFLCVCGFKNLGVRPHANTLEETLVPTYKTLMNKKQF